MVMVDSSIFMPNLSNFKTNINILTVCIVYIYNDPILIYYIINTPNFSGLCRHNKDPKIIIQFNHISLSIVVIYMYGFLGVFFVINS